MPSEKSNEAHRPFLISSIELIRFTGSNSNDGFRLSIHVITKNIRCSTHIVTALRYLKIAKAVNSFSVVWNWVFFLSFFFLLDYQRVRPSVEDNGILNKQNRVGIFKGKSNAIRVVDINYVYRSHERMSSIELFTEYREKLKLKSQDKLHEAYKRHG